MICQNCYLSSNLSGEFYSTNYLVYLSNELLYVVNDLWLLAMLAYKNISSTSNDIKRKHLNIYLYFQNYCNTIKINATL